MTKSTGKYLKRVNGDPIKSFHAKYIISDTGCWEWIGSIGIVNGYGQLNLGKGKMANAHRFSYELYIGDIPKGMFVCHKCDNRKCCSPFHLFLGTNEDNMKDASSKGRLTKGFEHPSVYNYIRKGCRCDECKAMFKEYNKWCGRNRKNPSGSSKKDEVLTQTANKPVVTNADTVNVDTNTTTTKS